MTDPLNPLDFLAIADMLSEIEGQAALRSAINRAYFALYLLARDKTGTRPSRKETHQKVISATKSLDRAAGDQLAKLQRLRRVADYEIVPVDAIYSDRTWFDHWKQASNLATNVLARLQRQ